MQQTFTLRPVRASDIDSLATINVAVWHQDWNFKYRFPHAQEFPDDYFKHSQMKYLEALEKVEQGVYSGIVAEAPSKSDGAKSEVVAYAICWLPGARVQASRPSNQTEARPASLDAERRDADMARVKVFREVVAKARKAWFDDKYGNRQLWLATLAVNPDYQRCGIASALVNWSLEIAKAENVPVGLLASAVAKKLYLKLGFESVGTERVQVDGEDEYYMVEGMVRKVQ